MPPCAGRHVRLPSPNRAGLIRAWPSECSHNFLKTALPRLAGKWSASHEKNPPWLCLGELTKEGLKTLAKDGMIGYASPRSSVNYKNRPTCVKPACAKQRRDALTVPFTTDAFHRLLNRHSGEPEHATGREAREVTH